MYYSKSVLFFSILLLITLTAKADIISVRPEGVPESRDYKVWVDDQEVFTGQAGDDHHGLYSFCTFDFTGSIKVRIRSLRAVKWLDIMPSGLEIDYRTMDDFTFEFVLEEPKMITVLVNNDKSNALHLLTSRPETKKPDPSDENILFYKGGKVYDIGVLDLKDNQTLYIEGGAVLKGMVRIKDAKNVRILGRGMIDGSENESSGNDPSGNQKWRLIYMLNSENLKIEGITLFNSLRWTIHAHACTGMELNNIRVINWDYGSDGTDLSACQDVKILNSFYRTNDDPIVIKALSFDENSYYPNPPVKNPDVKNILVEGCALWNMPYGNVLEIGFELRCDRVSDITFRDCDVLMSDHRGAVFGIHNSDYAIVEDVLFENIRVENADLVNGHKLFDIAILYSMWSYDKFEDPEMIRKYRYNDAWDNLLPVLPGKEAFHAQFRGHVRNIHFKDIQILDGKLPYSVINGFDEDHLVEKIVFENISIQGRNLTNKKELKLYTKYAKDITIK